MITSNIKLKNLSNLVPPKKISLLQPEIVKSDLSNSLADVLDTASQLIKERDELKRKFDEIFIDNCRLIYAINYLSQIVKNQNNEVQITETIFNMLNEPYETKAFIADLQAKGIEACADALLLTDDISCEYEYPLMREFASKLRI